MWDPFLRSDERIEEKHTIYAMAFAADRSRLAALRTSEGIEIWSLNDGERIWSTVDNHFPQLISLSSANSRVSYKLDEKFVELLDAVPSRRRTEERSFIFGPPVGHLHLMNEEVNAVRH